MSSDKIVAAFYWRGDNYMLSQQGNIWVLLRVGASSHVRHIARITPLADSVFIATASEADEIYLITDRGAWARMYHSGRDGLYFAWVGLGVPEL